MLDVWYKRMGVKEREYWGKYENKGEGGSEGRGEIREKRREKYIHGDGKRWRTQTEGEKRKRWKGWKIKTMNIRMKNRRDTER